MSRINVTVTCDSSVLIFCLSLCSCNIIFSYVQCFEKTDVSVGYNTHDTMRSINKQWNRANYAYRP